MIVSVFKLCVLIFFVCLKTIFHSRINAMIFNFKKFLVCMGQTKANISQYDLSLNSDSIHPFTR